MQNVKDLWLKLKCLKSPQCELLQINENNEKNPEMAWKWLVFIWNTDTQNGPEVKEETLYVAAVNFVHTDLKWLSTIELGVFCIWRVWDDRLGFHNFALDCEGLGQDVNERLQNYYFLHFSILSFCICNLWFVW